MSCLDLTPVYIPPSKRGIESVISHEDGYQLDITWRRAYPSKLNNIIIYNIYFSSNMDDVFTEGVRLVSIDGTYSANLVDFSPGDLYYFAVRAVELDLTWFLPSMLPDAYGGLKYLPEGMLLSALTTSSSEISLTDIATFPPMGIVQLGYELIRYNNVDYTAGKLLSLTRGFNSSSIRPHGLDGYDGYVTTDAFVHFWKGMEDTNDITIEQEIKFDYPNYAFTVKDGYKTIDADVFNTDLNASDTSQTGFIRYDYSGWRRTSPWDLLSGKCVGTYFGGSAFCADGYGVGFQVRGIPFQDAVAAREEQQLETIGEPCILLKRKWTGIRCSCISAGQENPYLRCTKCFSTGFLTGYDQFFNPRRSDGKLLVRFDPTEDQVRTDEEGLESVFLPNCWSLVVPSIHSRDIIIRQNEDGSEEFRYEVQSVTRNKLLNGMSGMQKFATQRLRKTDPVYQWLNMTSTANVPQILTTGIGLLRGPNNTLIPHTHELHINENIINLSQINQTTSISAGHNHRVVNGQIQMSEENEQIGHQHSIIFT